MLTPLTPADFPLIWIDACVYRRTCSSPLFTAPSPELAADLVSRLNTYEAGKVSLRGPVVAREPGHGWELTEDAKASIRDIEAHIVAEPRPFK